MLPDKLWLDLLITLRCNAACPNCMKFCNMKEVTGLDYSQSDMTIGQIEEFMRQVKEVDTRHIFFTVTVTGGEPLLHPQVALIMQKLEVLRREEYIKDLTINTNLTLPIPKDMPGKVLNFSKPEQNSPFHNTVLLHPSEFGGRAMTFESCRHYRKDTIVLSYLGYAQCCAGEAYARLFGMKDLFAPEFPRAFPIGGKGMDKVCGHCPFGDEEKTPFERDLGRPVAAIYKREAAKNKRAERITARFGEAGQP